MENVGKVARSISSGHNELLKSVFRSTIAVSGPSVLLTRDRYISVEIIIVRLQSPQGGIVL